MRNAFIDAFGVLQAIGAVSRNEDTQTVVPVSDDFALDIGQWCWDGTQWLKHLPYFQAAQMASIQAACQAAILGGFSSSALGTPHTYPAKSTDQQNLSASVLASLMPGIPANWTTPFWCEDSSGLWSMVPHTAAQIQQVGQDGKAAILAAIIKNQTLSGQIMAATTIAGVQAIVWG